MQIHGLQKLTLLDFPGHIACTVFTGGCNFRCPFCHNGGLVLEPEKAPLIPEEEFFAFLESRKGRLEGVAVTGGEPTVNGDLPEFLKRIKDMGFAVKLDSNGQNPDMLERIIKEDKVVEVCDALDYPVILVGGPEDAARGERIKEKVGTYVGNSCGTLTLGQSASLLELADAVITNDTGMMHIAAALRKPIVSVWGNTVPEFGMYPYLPQGMKPAVIIENKGLRCRPCDKLGYAKCPRGHFNCMNLLDAKEIAEKTKAELSSGS